MKNFLSITLIFCFIFSSCEKEYDFDLNSSSSSSTVSLGNCGDECNEWERCVNISQDFFGFEEGCRPKLHLYTNHGNWDAAVTVVDQYGNSYFYELEDLRAHTVDLQYINIDFPVNTLAYNYEHGFFPDPDTYHLTFEFTDSKTLEFTVNDMVYDPHVESSVLYNGTGQLIHTGGSADAVIEFSCNYLYEGENYSVSFSATRYN
tara:strand:+ start:107 stop:718 length:612 start_codon:yes stop_codon:yes gene_type:complete